MTSSEPVVLSRTDAAAAVQPAGWRILLGGAYTSVSIDSPSTGAEVVAAAVRACGAHAAHLHADLRADRVELALSSPANGRVTDLDVDLTGRVSAAVSGLGLATTPGAAGRRVQALEIAIDALDIPAVLPFWRAVLGYADPPGEPGVDVVDPAGQGPTVWFQQLDQPRPQRNRIHFDLHVADDEAAQRIAAAVAAGGRVIGDAEAPAFWILADPEGNEVCVCTWQARD